MIKKQQGFTLIELVMVIVILGILAAFALPRFADLGGQARAAAINGVAGAMKSAASIARAKQLASNAGLNEAVSLEGQAINMKNGYPAPSDTGIIVAASILASDFDFTTVDATAGTITLKPVGYTPATGLCQVVYTEAKVDSATGVLSAPFKVEVTTTGCGN